MAMPLPELVALGGCPGVAGITGTDVFAAPVGGGLLGGGGTSAPAGVPGDTIPATSGTTTRNSAASRRNARRARRVFAGSPVRGSEWGVGSVRTIAPPRGSSSEGARQVGSCPVLRNVSSGHRGREGRRRQNRRQRRPGPVRRPCRPVDADHRGRGEERAVDAVRSAGVR